MEKNDHLPTYHFIHHLNLINLSGFQLHHLEFHHFFQFYEVY